jgi:enoyl-CoA hydratase/carnithine racemase
MQVMSLLQGIAPLRLVNEWALTGEPFDANAAQAAGLLNYVVPAAELDAKVEWLIGRIVDKSPTAIRRGKYAMRAIASMSFDQSIAYTESQIALLAMTEDAKGRPESLRRKAQAFVGGQIARLTSSSQLSLEEPAN